MHKGTLLLRSLPLWSKYKLGLWWILKAEISPLKWISEEELKGSDALLISLKETCSLKETLLTLNHRNFQPEGTLEIIRYSPKKEELVANWLWVLISKFWTSPWHFLKCSWALGFSLPQLSLLNGIFKICCKFLLTMLVRSLWTKGLLWNKKIKENNRKLFLLFLSFLKILEGYF